MQTTFSCIACLEMNQFFNLPQVKEVVKAAVLAGWSCTLHVKVIPVSKDSFCGRRNTLKRYASRLWLSVTWKHFGFPNRSEDSTAPSVRCSDSSAWGWGAGRVQLVRGRWSIMAPALWYVQVRVSSLGWKPPVRQKRAHWPVWGSVGLWR